MAQKTNYVEKEIKKLEKYVQQLQTYLDDHPANEIEDRIDEQYNNKTGATIIKVISSRESQLKAFMDTIQKLPKFIEDLNNLRKSVSGKKDEVKEARGNTEIPSYMKNIKSEDQKEQEEEKSDDPDEW